VPVLLTMLSRLLHCQHSHVRPECAPKGEPSASNGRLMAAGAQKAGGCSLLTESDTDVHYSHRVESLDGSRS
jgi:hypothetical protein